MTHQANRNCKIVPSRRTNNDKPGEQAEADDERCDTDQGYLHHQQLQSSVSVLAAVGIVCHAHGSRGLERCDPQASAPAFLGRSETVRFGFERSLR